MPVGAIVAGAPQGFGVVGADDRQVAAALDHLVELPLARGIRAAALNFSDDGVFETIVKHTSMLAQRRLSLDMSPGVATAIAHLAAALASTQTNVSNAAADACILPLLAGCCPARARLHSSILMQNEKFQCCPVTDAHFCYCHRTLLMKRLWPCDRAALCFHFTVERLRGCVWVLQCGKW